MYLSKNSVKELEQELNTLRADHEALKKQHQQQLTNSGSSVGAAAAAAAVAATKARQFSGKFQFQLYFIFICLLWLYFNCTFNFYFIFWIINSLYNLYFRELLSKMKYFVRNNILRNLQGDLFILFPRFVPVTTAINEILCIFHPTHTFIHIGHAHYTVR